MHAATVFVTQYDYDAVGETDISYSKGERLIILDKYVHHFPLKHYDQVKNL